MSPISIKRNTETVMIRGITHMNYLEILNDDQLIVARNRAMILIRFNELCVQGFSTAEAIERLHLHEPSFRMFVRTYLRTGIAGLGTLSVNHLQEIKVK